MRMSSKSYIFLVVKPELGIASLKHPNIAVAIVVYGLGRRTYITRDQIIVAISTRMLLLTYCRIYITYIKFDSVVNVQYFCYRATPS